MSPLSYIEISRSSLLHNVRAVKSLLPKGTKIAVSIKANAYGHGQNDIARILEKEVDYFQINSIEELRSLRTVTKKPVLLLGYIAESDLKETLLLGCQVTVFSITHARAISSVAKRIGKRQKIHLAIDAHLGREGILPEEIFVTLQYLKKLKNIELVGIYAHFANIEDSTNLVHAKLQIRTYENVLKVTKEFGYNKIMRHISASSGVMALDGFCTYDLVRVGVGLYGMWPSEHLQEILQKKFRLLPVMRWVSHIALVKWLPKGHTVGYGLTYKTTKPIKIAIVPQGYADGYARGLSNRSEVLIQGKRCKVIGRVSMNMFVTDVTKLKNVQREDEVVLLGKQQKQEITAEEMALTLDTINYEVTTRVSSLLPRRLAK